MGSISAPPQRPAARGRRRARLGRRAERHRTRRHRPRHRRHEAGRLCAARSEPRHRHGQRAWRADPDLFQVSVTMTRAAFRSSLSTSSCRRRRRRSRARRSIHREATDARRSRLAACAGFFHARDGAVSIMVAAFGVCLIASLALAVDVASVYLQKRRGSGRARPRSARRGAFARLGGTGRAREPQRRTGWLRRRSLTVMLGRYDADAKKPADATLRRRRRAGQRGETRDAAQRRRSCSARRCLRPATFPSRPPRRRPTRASPPSRSARGCLSVNGGLANAVLSKLLGAEISLTAMDYNALASAQVDMPDLLNALAPHVGVQAGTYDSVLATNPKIGDFGRAIGDVAGVGCRGALRAVPRRGPRFIAVRRHAPVALLRPLRQPGARPDDRPFGARLGARPAARRRGDRERPPSGRHRSRRSGSGPSRPQRVGRDRRAAADLAVDGDRRGERHRHDELRRGSVSSLPSEALSGSRRSGFRSRSTSPRAARRSPRRAAAGRRRPTRTRLSRSRPPWRRAGSAIRSTSRPGSIPAARRLSAPARWFRPLLASATAFAHVAATNMQPTSVTFSADDIAQRKVKTCRNDADSSRQ